MLTLAQIGAIIGLLMAFHVPQPTVDIVQQILDNAHVQTVQTVTPALLPIQLPTAPIFGNIVLPSAPIVKDAPIATTISAEIESGSWYYGGYCGLVSIVWSVKDQYGNEMPNAVVTVDGSVVKNRYVYSSPNFNTTDIVTLVADGRVSTTVPVIVRGSMLVERGENSFFKNTPDFWTEASTGNAYYPATNTCKRI